MYTVFPVTAVECRVKLVKTISSWGLSCVSRDVREDTDEVLNDDHIPEVSEERLHHRTGREEKIHAHTTCHTAQEQVVKCGL